MFENHKHEVLTLQSKLLNRKRIIGTPSPPPTATSKKKEEEEIREKKTQQRICDCSLSSFQNPFSQQLNKLIVCTNLIFFSSFFRNHLCNYAYMLIDRKWPGLLRSFRSEWAHFLLIKVKSWRKTMSISCKSTEVWKFELIHAF